MTTTTKIDAFCHIVPRDVLDRMIMPFGPPGGQGFLPTSIRVVERLGLPPDQQEQVFAGNARRVLGVTR